MTRTLSEIYARAKEKRDEYLELTEFRNNSKMSVIDAFTWVTAACVWASECIMDVFKVDVAKELHGRINGTPAYYVNALLKYQDGDILMMNDEGTAFSYASENESKRIVTTASYSEEDEPGFHDKRLILKVATGSPGEYERIDSVRLLGIQAYIDKISFAGTHAVVVSRKGDILIPRVTVYHDGSVSNDEILDGIVESLNEFSRRMPFDGVVYVQKVIDAIQAAEHVVDVYVDPNLGQGIFVAQHDDYGNLIDQGGRDDGEPCYEARVTRFFTPHSGYITQSSGTGEEEGIQTWRESFVLRVEGEQPYGFSWGSSVCAKWVPQSFSWGTHVCAQVAPFAFSWGTHVCATEEPYAFSWGTHVCATEEPYAFSWGTHVCATTHTDALEWEDF